MDGRSVFADRGVVCRLAERDGKTVAKVTRLLCSSGNSDKSGRAAVAGVARVARAGEGLFRLFSLFGPFCRYFLRSENICALSRINWPTSIKTLLS